MFATFTSIFGLLNWLLFFCMSSKPLFLRKSFHCLLPSCCCLESFLWPSADCELQRGNSSSWHQAVCNIWEAYQLNRTHHNLSCPTLFSIMAYWALVGPNAWRLKVSAALCLGLLLWYYVSSSRLKILDCSLRLVPFLKQIIFLILNYC